MLPFDRIREYKQLVCSQIRWKKAHEIVSTELEHHILDQRDAFIASGDDEETAITKAIQEMGDPILVGSQLDLAHRPKSQKTMLLLTMSMLLIGLFIRLFIIHDSDYPFNLPKQIIATILGLGLMFIAYFKDFTIIRKYPKIIYMMVLISTILLMITSSNVNGKPYFLLPFISFNGAYLTLLFPLTLVTMIYFTRKYKAVGLIRSVLFLFVLIGISFLLSSMGGVLLIIISGLLLLSIATHKNWYKVNRRIGYLIIYLPVILLFLYGYLNNQYYYIERFKIALNPIMEFDGKGYIGTLTNELIRNAKFIGRGTLPEQYAFSAFPAPNIDTDYLLTYLIFNIGWIAFYIIITALVLFILKGFMLCFKQRSVLGTLVSFSIMVTLTFEVISYVIWNLGFQLIPPISLPLISYGNVATVINLALIGIMLSVFRSGDIVKDYDIRIEG